MSDWKGVVSESEPALHLSRSVASGLGLERWYIVEKMLKGRKEGK